MLRLIPPGDLKVALSARTKERKGKIDIEVNWKRGVSTRASELKVGVGSRSDQSGRQPQALTAPSGPAALRARRALPMPVRCLRDAPRAHDSRSGPGDEAGLVDRSVVSVDSV